MSATGSWASNWRRRLRAQTLQPARTGRPGAQHRPPPDKQRSQARQIARFSGWRFNLANNRLTSPECEEHALSTAESELLKVFISNPNRILQRES